MNEFSPKAQADAISHLTAKLNKIAGEASFLAQNSQSAAEEAATRKWRVRHEESAEFHRALAALIPQVVATIRNGNLDHACSNCDGIDPGSCVFNAARES